MARTHDCPGGCGEQVPYYRLACPLCWFRLPAAMRTEITAAYRKRSRYPAEHLTAIGAATRWYRQHM